MAPPRDGLRGRDRIAPPPSQRMPYAAAIVTGALAASLIGA